MPTSSQSLIIQSTNGQLPPFFGRHVWRAEPPPGLEWANSEYPVTNVQIRQDVKGSDNKRYRTGRKPQPLKRTGSAPELACKVDFSSLPKLLKIRGLHGTVRYDSHDKYVSWRINSTGPFYNRINLTGQYTIAGKRTPGTIRYFHANRANDSMYTRDETVHVDDMHRLEYRKQVHFNDQGTNFNNESNSNECFNITNDVFMSIKEHDGKLRMTRTQIENASYFMLVQIKDLHSESGNLQTNKIPLFRLESCQANEVGCFRLSPTVAREVGDFKLVPQQGYLADDFRLVPSSEEQGAFVLLQSVPGNPGQFHPVLRNRDSHEEFRFLQAKIQHRINDDVIVPREAWGNSHSFFEEETNSRRHDKTENDSYGHHRYDNFHDIRDPYIPVESDNLPDISLNGSKRSNMLQRQPSKPTTAKNYGAPCTFDNDLKTFNRHLDEFNERYQDSMRHVTSQGYKRFINDDKTFGDDNENRKGTVVGAGYSSSVFSSEWKTHNFDQWSRTTKDTYLEPLEPINAGVTRKLPVTDLDKNKLNQEEESLLDEVRFKENYKQWKKKKVSTVRMRKTLPKSDPNAVCIRFEDRDISHDELKAKIERETGQKVSGLQFDPVSVHSIEPETTSRWIVRFPEASICDELSQNGLKINGVKLRVRKFDDVMREEHEAYKLFKLVKEFTDKKSKKKFGKNDVKIPKIMKTMQTQTK